MRLLFIWFFLLGSIGLVRAGSGGMNSENYEMFLEDDDDLVYTSSASAAGASGASESNSTTQTPSGSSPSSFFSSTPGGSSAASGADSATSDLAASSQADGSANTAAPIVQSTSRTSAPVSTTSGTIPFSIGQYGASGDAPVNADTSTGTGVFGNSLTAGVTALSPAVVAAYNVQPGDVVGIKQANGSYLLGYYADNVATVSSSTMAVDFYQPAVVAGLPSTGSFVDFGGGASTLTGAALNTQGQANLAQVRQALGPT